jgi:hypothetical protein
MIPSLVKGGLVSYAISFAQGPLTPKPGCMAKSGSGFGHSAHYRMLALLFFVLFGSFVYSAESTALPQGPIMIDYDLLLGTTLSCGAETGSSSVFWGLSRSMREILSQYGESKDSLEKYRIDNALGNLFVLAGAGYVAAYFLMGSGAEKDLVFSSGLYFRVSSIGMLGLLLKYTSYKEILYSVNRYNSMRFDELSKGR